jgi:ubiquinone/menaquinone biosynthesis C-methylase UbiE
MSAVIATLSACYDWSFSMHRCLLYWLSCCLLAAPLLAQEQITPSINLPYHNPDVAQWRGIFERDGREVWDRREQILQALDLKAGQQVADIGAGTGFFSLMMAREVGPVGHVYAVDIAKNFVDGILARADAAGLHNVSGVVNDQNSVMLAPASLDLVFISDTYHHFERPDSILASIHQALKPGGEMVVIDFKRIPGRSSPWVLGHVRAGERQVTKEIEAMGFRLTERLDFMHTQYFLRFRKPRPD